MKSNQCFLIEGRKIHKYPTMDQFISEAGITTEKQKKLVKLHLQSHGIEDVSQLYSYTVSELSKILGTNKNIAKQLVKHLQVLRRQAPLILSGKELARLKYRYLTTGNTLIDMAFTYSNMKMGLRSKVLLELFGSAGVGKTQFAMTVAAMCLRLPSDGGWGRPVLYIDTEGSFDFNRFKLIAQFWGVSPSTLDEQLIYARVYNFDELEEVLNQISIKLRTLDLGIIIVDSIIDPLKVQYPLDESLQNLQQRQQHLKQVIDQLKSLAQMHDLIALITNQVRVDPDQGRLIPQGGNVLAHAVDIRCRMYLLQESQEHWGKMLPELQANGISLGRIEIADCGFLPQNSGEYLLGPFGMGDPSEYSRFLELVKQIKEEGVLTYNSKMERINRGRDRKLAMEEIKSKLY